MSLNYGIFPENVASERVVALIAVEINWFHIIHALVNSMIDSIHAWLKKDYKLPDMFIAI